MENCTIYSHQLDFEQVAQIVQEHLPKAKVEVKDGGLQKSLTATIKGGFFSKTKTLKINYRQRQNPSYKLDAVECGLTQNLAGMVNFIQSLPAKNETLRDKFLAKVMSANCEMPFMAEPEMTPAFETVLRKIVHDLDAFIFTAPSRLFNQSNAQHFVDKNFNLILDPEGNTAIDDLDVRVDAKYHDRPSEEYTEEQITRKTQSEVFLAQHEVKVNSNLPCLPAVSETSLRSTSAIVDRAYALLIIAVKGEGIEQEHLVRTVADKQITSFSPKESQIYEAATLDDQDRAYAVWRYESLYVLLWALGMMEDLKYPNDICDVKAVVGKIFQPSRADFEAAVQLRGTAEILAELDKTYRMNWACVDARIKQQEASGNLNSSVVYERHYALNWLTQYQNQAWDDVQTNT